MCARPEDLSALGARFELRLRFKNERRDSAAHRFPRSLLQGFVAGEAASQERRPTVEVQRLKHLSYLSREILAFEKNELPDSLSYQEPRVPGQEHAGFVVRYPDQFIVREFI